MRGERASRSFWASLPLYFCCTAVSCPAKPSSSSSSSAGPASCSSPSSAPSGLQGVRSSLSTWRHWWQSPRAHLPSFLNYAPGRTFTLLYFTLLALYFLRGSRRLQGVTMGLRALGGPPRPPLQWPAAPLGPQVAVVAAAGADLWRLAGATGQGGKGLGPRVSHGAGQGGRGVGRTARRRSVLLGRLVQSAGPCESWSRP